MITRAGEERAGEPEERNPLHQESQTQERHTGETSANPLAQTLLTLVLKFYESIDEEERDKVYLVFELANLFSLQDLCDIQKQLSATGQGLKDPITSLSLSSLGPRLF